MTVNSVLRWSAFALLLDGAAPAAATGMSCASLVTLTVPQVTITFAAETPAGLFKPPGAPASFERCHPPPVEGAGSMKAFGATLTWFGATISRLEQLIKR